MKTEKKIFYFQNFGWEKKNVTTSQHDAKLDIAFLCIVNVSSVFFFDESTWFYNL